jgi:prepilin-type N-terminal cleavage/methylation domain-containing protein
MRNEKAFTLTELIVVVVVLAIISAIVVTAAVDTVDMKSDLTAREIMRAISFAKSYSLSRRLGYRVVFTPASDQVRVEDINGNVAWNPISYSAYSWNLQNGDITSADFGGASFLEFGTTGEAVAGGNVVIQYRGLLQTLTVSPITGRVAVSEVRQ